MKNSIRARFKEVVEGHIIGKLNFTEHAVAESLSITDEELKNVLDGDGFLTLDTAAKFFMAFPEICPEWLLLGWGDKIKKVDSKMVNHNYTINNDNSSHLRNEMLNGSINIGENVDLEMLKAQKDHAENLVAILERHIELLEESNAHLKKEIERLKEVKV